MNKYTIIYADPPWSFGSKMASSNKNESQRKIEQAYSVMTSKEIANLPVKKITYELHRSWKTRRNSPQ
jgi:N6-adenosine-specific RNA methylase IME4